MYNLSNSLFLSNLKILPVRTFIMVLLTCQSFILVQEVCFANQGWECFQFLAYNYIVLLRKIIFVTQGITQYNIICNIISLGLTFPSDKWMLWTMIISTLSLMPKEHSSLTNVLMTNHFKYITLMYKYIYVYTYI